MNAFPRDWADPTNGWLWEHNQGLFDVKPVNEMQIVQAAGYGGGSLIYANVHLRPPADVFAQGWPAGYSRQLLDPYYDLVAYMLDIKPITESNFKGLPPKTVQLRQAAANLGRLQQFCYPHIAVDFGAPDTIHANKFRRDQKGCVYCGECDIGCNYHAKNTLDLNYLAVAEDAGAEVATQCEAFKIEPTANGYRVHVRDHSQMAAERVVEATRVFVCAGAVNSTELLLRCRDDFGSLPNLSGRLGDHYSGNGDFLAFAFNTQQPQEPWNGPTITGGIVVDQGTGPDRVWFILEDGGHPRQIAALLQVLNPRFDWLRGVDVMMKDDLQRLLEQTARQWLTRQVNVGDDVALFLVMGRDRSDGHIRLLPVTRALSVEWDVRPNLELYNTEEQIAHDFADALGGQLALNPAWRLLRLPVSVHNLGGCAMAVSPADGVTNPFGEVHSYPGLYVLDGAIIPSSTGVNPASTIAAVAEYNVERVIRSVRNDPNWRAPEFAAAALNPVADPLASIVIPAGGTPPSRTPLVGLAFSETMRGFIQPGVQAEDIPAYVAAERAAQAANQLAEFSLTIAIIDLDRFLDERSHAGIANGHLRVDGFTDPEGVPVSNGVFNLFVEADNLDERRMLYALPFNGSDGNPYLLDGFKEVKDHGWFDVWGATTTLYTVIREGHSHEGAILGAGVIRLHLQDFLHQLTTFQITGTTDAQQRVEALNKFGRMFFGTLWDVFVKPRLPQL
jgi:cholesterol oxidase